MSAAHVGSPTWEGLVLLDVVHQQAAVDRHRSTLFAPYLDEYLDDLQRLGHGSVSIRNHLRLVTRLGEHLATRRVHNGFELREEHLAEVVSVKLCNS